MRVGHPGVWAVLGALVALTIGATAPGWAQTREELEIYDVVPPRARVRMHPGERKEFAVWAAGEGLQYRWTFDGVPVGARRSWTFEATGELAGTHWIAVAIEGPSGSVEKSWEIDVEGPPVAAPAPDTTTSTSAPPTSSTKATTSSTSTSAAPSTTSSSTSSSSTSSTSTSSTTSSTRRPTTTRPPTTTSTRAPTTTTSSRPPTSTSTTTTTRPAPPTTRPPSGITESDVRALLARYAAAWQNKDAEGLRAIGQVSTDGQVEALQSYFESVQNLEVSVTVLEITTSGDEARVRFVRRDTFRDPLGNPVRKESPPIEKRVIRTPGGLRFAPLQ